MCSRGRRLIISIVIDKKADKMQLKMNIEGILKRRYRKDDLSEIYRLIGGGWLYLLNLLVLNAVRLMLI